MCFYWPFSLCELSIFDALAPSGVEFGGPAETNRDFKIIKSSRCCLNKGQRLAKRRLDGNVKAERDEAQQQADIAEHQLLELKQETVEIKRLLEELRVEKDHVVTEKAEVSGQLEGVETDLVTARHCVRQLEHQLEDVSDEVDQLEWNSQRDME